MRKHLKVRELAEAFHPWPKDLETAWEIAEVHLLAAWEQGYEDCGEDYDLDVFGDKESVDSSIPEE